MIAGIIDYALTIRHRETLTRRPAANQCHVIWNREISKMLNKIFDVTDKHLPFRQIAIAAIGFGSDIPNLVGKDRRKSRLLHAKR